MIEKEVDYELADIQQDYAIDKCFELVNYVKNHGDDYFDSELFDCIFGDIVRECIKWLSLYYIPNGDCMPDNFVEYINELYWEVRKEN